MISRPLGAAARAAARAPLAATTLASGYLAGVTAAAWLARSSGHDRPHATSSPTLRVAVLIPAHNEEQLLAGAIDSLWESNYPRALLQVHVAADNCTDGTGEVALAHGAVVHDHRAPGGKGAALAHVIGILASTSPRPDAVAVVDADTVVSPEFVAECASWIAAGHPAVQAFYAVRDADTSAVTALRSAALAVRHYLRPLGRTFLGGSSGLYGNGMMFAFDLATEQRWSSHLTEDIEFQIDLLLRDTPVAFAAAARVEAEMPVDLAGSTRQNERWERGRLELLRRHALRLARPGRGWRARADTLADLALPPFSVLAAGTLAGTALAVVVGPRRWRAVAVGTGAAAVQAGYLLSGLVMTKAPRSVYRSLLHAPKLVAWKVVLWGRVMVNGADWVRTERNATEIPS